MNRAYELGYMVQKSGDPIWTNPYSLKQAKYLDWAYGWLITKDDTFLLDDLHLAGRRPSDRRRPWKFRVV